MKITRRQLAKAVAASTLLLSGAGYGQIEEIVITAELRETNVQDTPLAGMMYQAVSRMSGWTGGWRWITPSRPS